MSTDPFNSHSHNLAHVWTIIERASKIGVEVESKKMMTSAQLQIKISCESHLDSWSISGIQESDQRLWT